MKKRLLLISVFFTLSTLMLKAQDTIVAWTFPSTSADSLVDNGISINSSRYISCQYGTYGAASYYEVPIDYTTNGSQGSPDKCAKTTGWDNTVDSMCYMVKFKTTGYTGLKLYSKQQAGGSNPGPRDFKVQYKLSGSNVWTDIPNGTIVCASNDWAPGSLNGIDLPTACENLSSNVSIRWIITSNLDINGNALLATGISKIDDIVVTGTYSGAGISDADINGSTLVYPNPCKNVLNIASSEPVTKMEIYNMQGARVYSSDVKSANTQINVSDFDSGLYFVIMHYLNDNQVETRKIVIE